MYANNMLHLIFFLKKQLKLLDIMFQPRQIGHQVHVLVGLCHPEHLLILCLQHGLLLRLLFPECLEVHLGWTSFFLFQ
jgi:hypothetical protein